MPGCAGVPFNQPLSVKPLISFKRSDVPPLHASVYFDKRLETPKTWWLQRPYYYRPLATFDFGWPARLRGPFGVKKKNNENKKQEASGEKRLWKILIQYLKKCLSFTAERLWIEFVSRYWQKKKGVIVPVCSYMRTESQWPAGKQQHNGRSLYLT